MGTTACSKCGWDVDSAKAFCPECGEALVEEKKAETSSEFAEAGKTKQFSASMFNVILNADEKVEQAPTPPVEPAAHPPVMTVPKVRQAGVSSIKPIAVSTRAASPESKPVEASEPVQPTPPSTSEKKTGKLTYVLIALAAIAFFFIVALGLGGFIAWYYFKSKFGM